MPIEKNCLVCGKSFSMSPSRSYVNHCSRKCSNNDVWRRHISEGHRGKKLSLETREKIGDIHRKYYWAYDELYKLYWIDNKPENQIAKELGAGVGTIHNHLVKLGIPRRNRLKASRRKPNGAENVLIKLFENNNLPFDYTGNGKLIIGGKVPDFVHKTQKKIIEVFGVYWHSPLLRPETRHIASYDKTKEHYKQYGYDCLIIWEPELKDKRLLYKIICFLKK